MGFCIENTLLDISLTGEAELTSSGYELRNGRDNFNDPEFSIDMHRTKLPVGTARLGVGPEFRSCDKKIEVDVMVTGTVGTGNYTRTDPPNAQNVSADFYTQDQIVDQGQIRVNTTGFGGMVRFSYLPFESNAKVPEGLKEDYVAERSPWDLGITLGLERHWEGYNNEYGAAAFDASYNLYQLDSQPLASPIVTDLTILPNFGPIGLGISGSFYAESQRMEQLEGLLGGKPKGSLGPNGYYGSSDSGSNNPVAIGPTGKSDWQLVLNVDAAKLLRMATGKGQRQMKKAEPEKKEEVVVPKDLDSIGIDK